MNKYIKIMLVLGFDVFLSYCLTFPNYAFIYGSGIKKQCAFLPLFIGIFKVFNPDFLIVIIFPFFKT